MSEFPLPSLEDWRAVIDRDLKGASFEKRLVSHTPEGIALQPLYTEHDWAGAGDPAGYPGAWPFTRGAAATAGWTLLQEYEVWDPALVAADLADGAGAIRIPARELPDLDLSGVALFLDPGPEFVAAVERLEPAWSAAAGGSLGADPLGALARTGRVDGSPEEALAELGRLGARTAEAPLTAVEVATHAYHDAGASDAQDLGCALATGVEYLRAMTGAGLTVDQAADQLTFSLSLDCDLLLGITKLRTLRRLWARVLEASGAEPRGARVHVRTAWRVLTARDPWVNLLRATLSSFAAAVGGATWISPAPFDLAARVPSARARRLARTTHLILEAESHFDRVLDPAGGAYLFEALGEELARRAWAFFQEIEARGGQAGCLTSGWLLEQVQQVAGARARAVARRKQPITGVSDFPHLDEQRLEPGPPRPAPERGAGAWPRVRLAAPFEELQSRRERPRVFLASMGALAQHTGRTTWIANLLAAGGIEAAVDEEGYETPAAAAEAFASSGLKVAVICSSDAVYAELAEAVAARLKEAGAARVLLAGRGEYAGVDAQVHLGQDVLAVLRGVWEVLA